MAASHGLSREDGAGLGTNVFLQLERFTNFRHTRYSLRPQISAIQFITAIHWYSFALSSGFHQDIGSSIASAPKLPQATIINPVQAGLSHQGRRHLSSCRHIRKIVCFKSVVSSHLCVSFCCRQSVPFIQFVYEQNSLIFMQPMQNIIAILKNLLY